ncbi:hypothetical protein [Streptomyces zhihengii]|uniref:HNH endonuclease n=1 Tax=Streptomyces zhihengii TaxID=1818004 RepID=A0ABS2URC4_9ACTN|nr:hypothetical protein [Streptomyces zhihengii]MBM9619422.1 hypothetical protein [Streptomyces zhihengii]
MGTRSQKARDAQAGSVCPGCGRPVPTVVTRHKTLGTFVPHWGPGPCDNPDCSRSAAREAKRTG